MVSGAPKFLVKWQSNLALFGSRQARDCVAVRNFREARNNAAYSVQNTLRPAASLLALIPKRHLGLAQYGIGCWLARFWASMGILGTGFGDATLNTFRYRGQNNIAGERTIRATLTINTALGSLLAVWFGQQHLFCYGVFKIEPEFQR